MLLFAASYHSTRIAPDAVPSRRAKWEREAAFVADQNAQSSDLVQLNIGGERLLTVPRSTLTLEDNMLAAMFSGRHQLKLDDTGRVCVCALCGAKNTKVRVLSRIFFVCE